MANCCHHFQYDEKILSSNWISFMQILRMYIWGFQELFSSISLFRILRNTRKLCNFMSFKWFYDDGAFYLQTIFCRCVSLKRTTNHVFGVRVKFEWRNEWMLCWVLKYVCWQRECMAQIKALDGRRTACDSLKFKATVVYQTVILFGILARRMRMSSCEDWFACVLRNSHIKILQLGE